MILIIVASAILWGGIFRHILTGSEDDTALMCKLIPAATIWLMYFGVI